jgi:hypothetical protein
VCHQDTNPGTLTPKPALLFTFYINPTIPIVKSLEAADETESMSTSISEFLTQTHHLTGNIAKDLVLPTQYLPIRNPKK